MLREAKLRSNQPSNERISGQIGLGKPRKKSGLIRSNRVKIMSSQVGLGRVNLNEIDFVLQ